jgi:putative tryptophan/tyrosine transport system substrate-binding protein
MAADRRCQSITRRRFVHAAGVASLGLLAGCGRLPGQSQPERPPPPKVYRVGYLSSAGTAGPGVFLAALRELGYAEGENLVLETRLTPQVGDQHALARELVALGVDVIVTSAVAPARAASAATNSIPIVSAGIAGGDLIEAGLADSQARPGRNVTGLTTFDTDLLGKRLQLLTEVAPGMARVAILGPLGEDVVRDRYARTAEQLGVQLQYLELHSADEVDHAFEAMRQQHADALEVRVAPGVNQSLARIVALAVRQRLPTMGASRQLADMGGLMAYQPRTSDLWRRAAAYVDRILKGANPAELPIERPTTFDFIINLQTAQVLGLTIPQHVLLQATEVIQ